MSAAAKAAPPLAPARLGNYFIDTEQEESSSIIADIGKVIICEIRPA